MERPLTKNIKPGEPPLDLKQYEKAGGYKSVHKALETMTPQEVIEVVKKSNLRGRGGAGFPTGVKWESMASPNEIPGTRYLTINADEMEPATFKDRVLMDGDPHQLIEGMIVSAYAVQADVAYIFLRREYPLAKKLLSQAIAEAYDSKYLGKNILGSGYNLEMILHISAGRYICGEGSAVLNSIEGKRAIPRDKVPRETHVGLWGKPTITNNVETICNIPHIVNNGGEWFKSLSLTEGSGTKIYGASGKVKKPGWWELPMGTTLREIFEEHAGGMRNGLKMRGIIPGGASTEFLLEEHLDVNMDYDSVQKAGSRLGTGTIVVLDDKTCPVGMVHSLERFFARESCGWCTPCREGLPWIAATLEAIDHGKGELEDLDRLESQTKLLGMGHTFCALAPGAMEPLRSALAHFRDDFERHIREKRCPWR